MTHPFFKSKSFFNDIQLSLKPKVYTIVVIYLNGYKKEYQGITHPWEYMEKIKSNPKVQKCYIKE